MLINKQHIQNASWNIFQVFSYPLMMVIATPIFLNRLGAKEYGIWMLVNAIVNNLGMLNVGVGGAVINFVAKFRGENDTQMIKTVIDVSFAFIFRVASGIVFLSFVIFIVPADYILYYFDINSLLLFKSLFIIGVLTFAFKLIEQVVIAVFQGFELYDIASQILMVTRTISIIIGIVLVLLGYGLIHIFWGMLLWAIVAGIAELFILKKRFSFLRYTFRLDIFFFKEIFNYGKWIWSQSILGIINSQIDKYIVTFLVGLEYLAFYSIGLMVANQIQAMFSAATNWVFPYIARMKKETKKLESNYYKLQLTVIGTGILFISFVILNRKLIFTLWLGPENYSLAENTIELFLYFSVLSITSIIPYVYMNGGGFVKLNSQLMAVGTIGTVVFMVIFKSFYGVEGLIVGRIVTIAVLGILSRTILHRRLFGDTRIYSGLVILLPSIFLIGAFQLPVNFYMCILFSTTSIGTLLYLFFWKKIKNKII